MIKISLLDKFPLLFIPFKKSSFLSECIIYTIKINVYALTPWTDYQSLTRLFLKNKSNNFYVHYNQKSMLF